MCLHIYLRFFISLDARRVRTDFVGTLSAGRFLETKRVPAGECLTANPLAVLGNAPPLASLEKLSKFANFLVD